MNPRLFNLLVSELRRRPADVAGFERLVHSAARPGAAEPRGAPAPPGGCRAA